MIKPFRTSSDLINALDTTKMGVVKDIKTEDLMREGAKALIERLGYANVVRFIALLGGEGDSVKEIRKKG